MDNRNAFDVTVTNHNFYKQSYVNSQIGQNSNLKSIIKCPHWNMNLNYKDVSLCQWLLKLLCVQCFHLETISYLFMFGQISSLFYGLLLRRWVWYALTDIYFKEVLRNG